VDLDSDGMSDIWERKYNAEEADPDIDYDKDGMTTLEESVAGTDPFDANSVLRLRAEELNFSFSSGYSNNGEDVAIFDNSQRESIFEGLPEVAEFIIDELDTDGDGNSDFEEIKVGSDPFKNESELSFNKSFNKDTQVNGIMFVNVQFADQTGFVRVLVNDIDSTNNGVTDWEEAELNFESDAVDPGGNDLDDAIAVLNGNTIVSVRAAKSVANLTQRQNGFFEIVRSNGLGELTVFYSIGGSAIPGGDYRALTGRVIMPSGITSAEVVIEPLPSSLIDLSESVILTLSSDDNYVLGDASQQINIIREVPINVRSYGAVGDGIRDDTAAIQSAINALEESSQHNTLLFPTGTYALSSTFFTIHSTNTSNQRILQFGNNDLAGRDLVIRGEDGSKLLSTVSPVRSKMLLVLASFRSLSFENMKWEKTSALLSRVPPNREPNGAAGVAIVDVDTRDVESVTFTNCDFSNCHRSVTIDFADYTARGKFKNLVFNNCVFDNPYGSNTIDGTAAFGGGQQVYVSPWVDRVDYIANRFYGGSDLINATNNPGGIIKDGGHFGSPGEVRFINNVVQKMGVEGFYQTDDSHRLGITRSAFTIPPADGATPVTITVSFDPSFLQVGDLVSSLISNGNHNVFKVFAINADDNQIIVVNEGYRTNQLPGEVILRSRQFFLQSRERTNAIVKGNIFDECALGIVVSSDAEISHNLMYYAGILVNRPFSTPVFPSNDGVFINANFIRERPGGDSFTNAIYTFGANSVISNNNIWVEESEHFMGIRLQGSDALVINNNVSAGQATVKSYGNLERGVGIAIQHGGAGAVVSDNVTKNLNAGVGPTIPHAVNPRTVIRHNSINDQLAVDPRGGTTE